MKWQPEQMAAMLQGRPPPPLPSGLKLCLNGFYPFEHTYIDREYLYLCISTEELFTDTDNYTYGDTDGDLGRVFCVGWRVSVEKPPRSPAAIQPLGHEPILSLQCYEFRQTRGR